MECKVPGSGEAQEVRRSRCRQTGGGGGGSESPRRWWRRRASGGGAAPASAARDGSLFSGPTLSPRESPVTGGENSAGAAAPPCTDATPAPPGLDTSRTHPRSCSTRASTTQHGTFTCKYSDINGFKHCYEKFLMTDKTCPSALAPAVPVSTPAAWRPERMRGGPCRRRAGG